MKYLLPLILFFSCTPMGQHVPPAADKLQAPATPVLEPITLGKDGCTDRHWKDRGKMPIGAAKGIIESYKRAMKENHSTRPIIDKKNSKDVYLDVLKINGMASGNERRKTYAYLFGLCMRESNCNYSLGRDYTAKGPQSSLQAESGMWQFSMDGIGADPELKQVYAEAQMPGYDCMVSTFKEGLCDPRVKDCAKVLKPLRISYTGFIDSPKSGADFQKFFRSCPAAQVKYAAIMIRRLAPHFGPAKRREVEIVPACEKLLASYE